MTFEEFMSGDAVAIKDLCDYLAAAYEAYVNDPNRPPLRFVDGFMGVHNFHKAVVLDLATREGYDADHRRFLFGMAAGTFSKAMQEAAAEAVQP